MSLYVVLFWEPGPSFINSFEFLQDLKLSYPDKCLISSIPNSYGICLICLADCVK